MIKKTTSVFGFLLAFIVSLSISGNIFAQPLIRPQNVEGLPNSQVLIPFTVENFQNVTAFSFDIPIGNDVFYGGVYNVHPGVHITPPLPPSNVITVTYDSAALTLADATVLFHLGFNLLGVPGTDRQISMYYYYLEVSGLPVVQPPSQQSFAHIIDTAPLTLQAPNVGANLGEEFVMPITVSNFTGVREIDFTLTWNASSTEYLLTEFYDPRISFTDADGSDGSIHGTFLSNEPVDAQNGSPFMSLRFRLNHSPGVSPFNITVNEAFVGYPNLPYLDHEVVNGSVLLTHPTVVAGTVSTPHNTNVLVPITVNHFFNVNQFELNLGWDNSGVTLVGLQGIIPGITFSQTASTATAVYDGADLTLPDETILFYANFLATGEPGTEWLLDLTISTMMANGSLPYGAEAVRGQIGVTIMIPTFRPQSVSGANTDVVLMPVTAHDFQNIEAFQFMVTAQHNSVFDRLIYTGVQDVYPGVVITPPVSPFGQPLTASYNGASLTLPDSTILFYIAYELDGFNGTDLTVTFHDASANAWGANLPLENEVGIVHITDPTPMTFTVQHASGYPGTEVVVPVIVENFDHVRAVDFTLTWDPTRVYFQNLEFIDPNLSNLQIDGYTGTFSGSYNTILQSSKANGDTLIALRFLINDQTGVVPLNMSLTNVRAHLSYREYTDAQVNAGSIISQPPPTFTIAEVSGERLSTVNVPITVTNFSRINSASFYLQWDSTEIELNAVSFSIPTASQNIVIEEGSALIEFAFNSRTTLIDNTRLLNLNFDLIGDYGDASRVAFASNLPREVVVNGVSRDGIVFNFGGVTINPLIVSGYVHYPTGDAISNVDVVCSDNFANDSDLTDEYGLYSTTVTAAGPALFITPSKNDPEPLNGLDMSDVALISDYILAPQTSDLKTGYHVIAADVNADHVVTEADASLLEQIIMGDTLLPAYAVWRFVEANHVFADIHNPHPYPDAFEVPNYNILTSGDKINFVGMKVGDVNLSRDNTQQSRLTARTVTLDVSTTSLGDGKTKVEIRTADFTDVRAYQFTASWDAVAFELFDYMNAKGRHSVSSHESGHVITTLQQPTPTTFADGTSLLTFVLMAKNSENAATPVVSITEATMPVRVFGASLEKLSVDVIKSHQSAEADAFDTVDVYPNPGTSASHIMIHSQGHQQVIFEVSDLSGKIMYATTCTLAPGKNINTINTEPWAKGVYILNVRTSLKRHIVKIVKQ